MITKKLLPAILIFLMSTGLLANSFHANFEEKSTAKPSKSVVQSYDGVSFLYEFTDKGDKGHLYIGSNFGANNSRALIATSLSVGSLEPEQIEISRKDKKSFLFDEIYIKPNTEDVYVTAFLNGETVGETRRVDAKGKGKLLKLNGIEADLVVLSSMDMVQVAIDGFKGRVEESATSGLLMEVENVKPPSKKSASKMVVNELLIRTERKVSNSEVTVFLNENSLENSIVCYFDKTQSLLPNTRFILLDARNGVDRVSNAFYIDEESNTLRVGKSNLVDCEQLDAFALKVSIETNEGEAMQLIHLTVALNEVNDVAPIIASNQSCNLSVTENTIGNVNLCALAAYDADNAIESLSNWEIVSGNTNNLFSMTADGELRVENIEKLYNSNQTFFKLGVRVNDGVNQSEVTFVKVEVGYIAKKKEKRARIVKWPLMVEEKQSASKQETASLSETFNTAGSAKIELAVMDRKGIDSVQNPASNSRNIIAQKQLAPEVIQTLAVIRF